MKDKYGKVMTDEESVLRIWKEYYMGLMNEERRVPTRVKGKVYRVAVRPAMLYGLETVALTKRQEAEMEVAELKMLRFSLGVTRMDKIRNEYIKGQVNSTGGTV